MLRKVLAPLIAMLLLAVGIAAALGSDRPGTAIGDPAASIAPVATPPVREAQPTIFMRVTGAEQGPIPGSVQREGLEGWIEIIGLSHEIVSPRDAASGLPTGKRQHKPFVITKQLDKSTPLIFQALVNNERLTKVELRFYRPTTTGSEELYFTIELVNASIAGVQQENTTGVATETWEHVSFTYQKIVWTWVDGGITAEDDWETPVT